MRGKNTCSPKVGGYDGGVQDEPRDGQEGVRTMSMKFKRGDIVAYEDGIAVIATVPPRAAPYSAIGLNWMVPPSGKTLWFWNHPRCDFYAQARYLKLITKNAKTGSD